MAGPYKKSDPGTGMLFQPQKKSENTPDLRGFFVDDKGVEHQLSVWKVKDRETGQARVDKRGKTYFSIRATEDKPGADRTSDEPQGLGNESDELAF